MSYGSRLWMAAFVWVVALAGPAFSAEVTYKAVWEGLKDDGKAPQKIEIGQRWGLSNGAYPEEKILEKFGEPTLIGSSYTFVVEQGNSELVVYWVRKSSKQESNGSFVTTVSSGSSKLQKGETRVPLGGDLSVTVFVK